MNRKSVFETEHPYGSAVGKLIGEFSRLPGIGKKSAERLAQHVVSCHPEEAKDLANAISEVKSTIHPCPKCFFLTDQENCSICSNPSRKQNVLCIVEQSKDVVALEAASIYDGVYHVLGGKISPLDGVGPEDLTLNALIRRIRNDGIEEVVMATNPTLEGDGTALFISNLLEAESVKITRLARGIASGSVLEFANREMLADALRGRQEF